MYPLSHHVSAHAHFHSVLFQNRIIYMLHVRSDRLVLRYPLCPLQFLPFVVESGISFRFFFFRVLHTISPHLRAHAFARSVTVTRSSAVQASLVDGRRGGGPSYVAPRSHNPPTERRRDSPISSSLFSHGPPLCAVGYGLANRASPLQIQPSKTRPPPVPF